MVSQRFRKTPDFMKAVIKRCRCDAGDVGFAEIVFHGGRFEFAEHFL